MPQWASSRAVTPILAQGSRADRQFERMYRRHAGDVYRYALAVLRNPADAEDVTQTTFMNAYRAYTKGDRPETPKNWLIAIAHNVCRQRFRQAARRPNEVELNEELAESFVAEDVISVEDIRRALGHLAFNQRAALVMRELEGRSYAEIAEILDVSVAAVETLIFRARRALREQLEGALTCDEAELAISKQVDGRLPRAEKGPLRAHLRECKSCATLARRARAQKGAWKALAVVPLPASLHSLFGGSSASAAGFGFGLAGGGVAVKVAAVAATAALATGTAYEAKQIVDKPAKKAVPAAGVVSKAAAAPSARAYAPGQTKTVQQGPATRPAVPPGLAKKDEDVTVPTPPGQAKKTGTGLETSSPGKSELAPGHARRAETPAATATKKKKHKRPKRQRPAQAQAKKPQPLPGPKPSSDESPAQTSGQGGTGSGKK